MRIVFLDEEYALGIYEPDKLLVKIIWRGGQSSDEYRHVFMKALEIATERNGRFFLSDVRKQRVVGPADRKWFQEYALMKAVEGGLLKAAVVFEGNVFKKYYLNNILDTSKKFGLPLKFYYSVEEAEEWLQENIRKDGE
jgi:hypothetical protein